MSIRGAVEGMRVAVHRCTHLTGTVIRFDHDIGGYSCLCVLYDGFSVVIPVAKKDGFCKFFFSLIGVDVKFIVKAMEPNTRLAVGQLVSPRWDTGFLEALAQDQQQPSGHDEF